MRIWVIAVISLVGALGALSQQCGSQAGGAVCPGGLCCSQYGYCGSTSEYCTNGCQSQCTSGGGGGSTPTPSGGGGSSNGGDISSLISPTLFDQMLKHRNDAACQGKGFYTYEAFIAAAKSFSAFGTTGAIDTRKREIAAFFAQTSHETTGGWPTAPDGPYAWGYCYLTEQGNPGDYCVANPGDYCVADQQWPCAPVQSYYGRGPIQISYNFNYGPAGEAINSNLLHNPDIVATDPIISFKTALWFWMTPQSPKPSCHDVMTGQWRPSAADNEAGRVPGFGVVTNIINGGIECDKGANAEMENRIGFYKRYCDILGIGNGNNLDCSNQRPFNG